MIPPPGPRALLLALLLAAPWAVADSADPGALPGPLRVLQPYGDPAPPQTRFHFRLTTPTRALLERLRIRTEPVGVALFLRGPYGSPEGSNRDDLERELALGVLRSFREHAEGGLEFGLHDLEEQKELARRLGVRAPGTLVLSAGGRRHRLFLGDFLLVDVPGEKPRYRGEQLLASGLLRLLEERLPCLCFVGGHGEARLDDTGERGLSELRDELERIGYRLERVDLPLASGPAERCDVLVLAGTREELPLEEVRSLARHLRRGGGLYLLSETEALGAPLASLLGLLGVQVDHHVLVEPGREHRATQDLDLPTPGLNGHYITTPLIERAARVVLDRPRVLSYTRAAQRAMDVRTILQGSVQAWGESEPGEVPVRDSDDTRAPHSAAVALSSRLGANDARGLRGEGELRLVVTGDVDFVTNRLLPVGSGNLELFLNTARWLVRDPPELAIASTLVSDLRRP